MGNSTDAIWTLFKKDVLLEVRQQYAFYGVLLYVGATVFVLFMALEAPEGRVWTGLFWVIQLFISINAVAKSFLQESRQRMFYYQTLVGPVPFLLSKFLFNTVLMAVMGGLSFLLFVLFLKYPVAQTGSFLLLLFTGGWSLSLVFSFLAALAARAQQNAAIMAILGFPILIPQLVLLLQASNVLLDPAGPLPLANIALLLATNVLVILLGVILYPFLWRD